MTPADSDLHVELTLSNPDTQIETKLLVGLLQFAAVQEALQGELGIWLCTDPEIAHLHLEFMSIAGATDVITFPSGEVEEGQIYLGDIAVSVDTAVEQAHIAGHSVAREIAYLCLHGLLHLAGYDDLDDARRTTMIARQNQLMNEFEAGAPIVWEGDDS